MKVAEFINNLGSFQIAEREQPKIADGEILLQVKACGLCGTDILKVQKKSVPTGTVLGHEVSGIVAETKSEKFQKGDRVVVAHHVPCGDCHFCRHDNISMCAQFKKTNLDPGGFSEFLRIPEKHAQATALKIPDHLTFEEASFTEPLACCVRAVDRSNLLEGDSVLVVGLGVIGLLMVQLFVGEKMKVFATDLVPERLAIAEKFGASRWGLSGGELDMVLFTAGTPELFRKSFDWIRSGGKLHLFSSLSGQEAALPLNDIYHREIEIFSTYSSSPDTLQEALDLLESGSVRVKELISHKLPLKKLDDAIQGTLNRSILKAILTP